MRVPSEVKNDYATKGHFCQVLLGTLELMYMRIRDYFISSERNDYKPWIITPQALAVFCVSIWALRFFVPTAQLQAAPGIDPVDLMHKVNLERTQRFIPALATNNALMSASSGKAQDMLTRSYFAHVDPDGNYVWPRIEQAGYSPYLTVGENLAMDFSSASDVVSAWMNSPTHRANIVNEKFEDQGMASVYGQYEPSHDSIIVVNLFGALYKNVKATPPPPAPKSSPPPPAVKETPKPVVTKSPPPPTSSTPPPPTSLTSPTSPNTLPLAISEDAKIGTLENPNKTQINVNVVIQGNPSLVTANLKGQAITLLPGKVQGEYVGTFTFDPVADLAGTTVTVEARDEAGKKTSREFKFAGTAADRVEQDALVGTETIPVSNEAQVVKILRIVFGIFAGIYLTFLIIDGIIIRRAGIKRPGIHPDSHILLFFLIATITLGYNWF